MDIIADIASCRWVYMGSIGEPCDNELRIEILEARSLPALAGPHRSLKEALDLGLPLGSPIEHVSGCKIFTLHWENYVAYSVRNESFVMADDYEIFEGKRLVKYTRSRYLDFVKQATFAGDSYPGPSTHWGIFCLNHIIDVVSFVEPDLSVTVAK